MSQGFHQALHTVPVQLDAGGNDQALVIDWPGILQGDAIVLRVEPAHRGLDPVHAVGNERGGGFYRVALLEYARANQGPTRLVVVHLGGIDNGDIQIAYPSQQAGGDADARGARTDDQDVVMSRPRRAFMSRGGGRDAQCAAQVVAEFAGRCQQFLWLPALAQLGQRPQGD